MTRSSTTPETAFPVPVNRIERSILVVRGRRVMLAADLAEVYGVSTKRLNEQVKRNRGRFPEDFMFMLTKEETAGVVAICDHLRRLKFSATLPYAFTEHGVVMMASVLNTPIAVRASIEVVRAFVRLRQVLALRPELRLLMRRVDALEKGLSRRDGKYDRRFRILFGAIRQLIEPPLNPKDVDPIGFRTPTKRR